MKKFWIFLSGILLAFVLLFINPFDLYHEFRLKKTVNSIFSDPTIVENVGEYNIESLNIDYLGGKIFQVETENFTYLMKVDRDNSRDVVEIYEYKINVSKSDGY